MQIFKDRTEAGRLLADMLLRYKDQKPLVLALPRGGVPVAFEIARKLDAPLDTVVARKIGAPQDPEFGIGAIAPGDVVMLDTASIESLGLRKEDIDLVIGEEMKEMDRRMVHYNSGKYSKNAATDTVILVDDGLATGVTARAAIESIRLTISPKKIIFVAPICARDSARLIRDIADEVICAHETDELLAIGNWYREFGQTTDEEVLRCLESA